MTFRSQIRATVVRLLEAERLSADELATRAAAAHIVEFQAESERLAMASVRGMVKDLLRDLEHDEHQPTLPLPSLRLPSAIAVRTDDRIYYVLTPQATWTELVAGAEERDRNVTHAQQRRREYRAAMRRLAPLMEDEPDLTVAEALAIDAEGEAAS